MEHRVQHPRAGLRRPDGWPLRDVLVLSLIALFSLILGSSIMLNYRAGQQRIENQARLLSDAAIHRVQDRLDSLLQLPWELAEINRRMLENGTLALDDPEALRQHFWYQNQGFKWTGNTYLVTREGRFLGVARDRFGRFGPPGGMIGTFTQEPPPAKRLFFQLDEYGQLAQPVWEQDNYDPWQLPWFTEALQRRDSYWGAIFQYWGMPTAALPIRVPIVQNGEVRAVLSTDLLLYDIIALLQSLDISQQGLVLLVDWDGHLVASSQGKGAFYRDKGSSAATRLSLNDSDDTITRAIASTLDHHAKHQRSDPLQRVPLPNEEDDYLVRVVDYQDGRGLDWQLVVALPEASLVGHLRDGLLRDTLLLVVAFMISIIVGVALARRISQPLQTLQRASAALLQQDPTLTLPHSQIRELAELSRDFGIMRDRLQETLHSLQASEFRFSHLLHHLPVGVEVLDEAGTFSYANWVAQQLLDPAAGTEAPLSYRLYQANTDIPYADPPAARARRGELVYREDIEVDREGERIPLAVTSIPLRDSAGHITQVVNVFADIREQRHLQYLQNAYHQDLDAQVATRTAELAKAQGEAEGANQAKTLFLANMSHELRTPLNSVVGFADLLQDAGLSGEPRQWLEAIRRNSEHLSRLIQDLLDVARIEAQQMQLQEELVDLAALVKELRFSYRQRAERQGLSFQCPSYTLPRVRTDARRLRQIFINLLDNALKYTQQGEIGLSLRVIAEATDQVRLRGEVWDTGSGISAHQLTHALEPFRQFVDSQEASGGVGLGLALCQRLVALMGGTLHLQSRQAGQSWVSTCTPSPPPPPRPQGTTAWFELHVPVVRESLGPTPQALAGYHGPRRAVAVVDDNADNRALLSGRLRHWGFEVLSFEGARALLEAILPEPPVLLITDLVMPDMDGLTLIQQLRQQPTWHHTPMLVLSAAALPETCQRCLAGGATAFLSKPLNSNELASTLIRLLPLEWYFQATTDATMTLPEPALLEALQQHITRGDLRALRASLHTLEGDARYSVFSSRAGELLAQLRLKELDYWLSQLREDTDSA